MATWGCASLNFSMRARISDSESFWVAASFFGYSFLEYGWLKIWNLACLRPTQPKQLVQAKQS